VSELLARVAHRCARFDRLLLARQDRLAGEVRRPGGSAWGHARGAPRDAGIRERNGSGNLPDAVTRVERRFAMRPLGIGMSRQKDREDTPGTRQITDFQFTVHCCETTSTNIKPKSEARAILAGLNERQH